ncbi:hypothetical protein IscW_ISCW022486, partial [Ixodes scapularis]
LRLLLARCPLCTRTPPGSTRAQVSPSGPPPARAMQSWPAHFLPFPFTGDTMRKGAQANSPGPMDMYSSSQDSVSYVQATSPQPSGFPPLTVSMVRIFSLYICPTKYLLVLA